MLKTESLPVLMLMGPTASGKTQLAMDLYDSFPIEIISVDSALIYQGMDIGTAKPTSAEQAAYPHHLIDILSPSETYSAAEFVTDARKLIKDTHHKGKIPLLVGGTMLYFKALLEGLSPLPKADEHLRAQILEKALEQGWPALHGFLKQVDPKTAQRLHENDGQRISRALEVYYLTDKPLSLLQEEKGPCWDYPTLQFALLPEDRGWLHERIARRFELMLEQGFIAEVESLMRRGDLSIDMPSMRSVGYRQAWEYLEGKCDKETFIFKGIAATRQLAKRQITWLRSWQGARLIDCQRSQSLSQRVILDLRSQIEKYPIFM
ncbi:tRNA (adenosine(37)-N6)-dimethylallyltransferase MiaA [Thorsellia kenyensis]|uniref:tRNA dimethylallyltransferase n=1 Tax=Thorsellia kenyensis TaxID=1549888 RepID=A0ABV6C9T8_9GAMM